MDNKIQELEKRIYELEEHLNDNRKFSAASDIALFQILGWDNATVSRYLELQKAEVNRLRAS